MEAATPQAVAAQRHVPGLRAAAGDAGEGLRGRHRRRSDDRRRTGGRRAPQRVRRDDGRRGRKRPREARHARRGRHRQPGGRPRQRRHLAARPDRVGSGVCGERGWDERRAPCCSRSTSAGKEARRSINLSLSGLDHATGDELAWLEESTSSVMRASRDISVVAGAGNNAAAVGYPARFRDCFRGGRQRLTGTLCPFSNRGDRARYLGSRMRCGGVMARRRDRFRRWHLVLDSRGDRRTGSTTRVSPGPRLQAQAERFSLQALTLAEIDARAAFIAAGLAAPARRGPAAGRLASPDHRLECARARTGLSGLSELGVRAPKVRCARYRRGTFLSSACRAFQTSAAPFSASMAGAIARSSGLLRLQAAACCHDDCLGLPGSTWGRAHGVEYAPRLPCFGQGARRERLKVRHVSCRLVLRAPKRCALLVVLVTADSTILALARAIALAAVVMCGFSSALRRLRKPSTFDVMSCAGVDGVDDAWDEATTDAVSYEFVARAVPATGRLTRWTGSARPARVPATLTQNEPRGVGVLTAPIGTPIARHRASGAMRARP